MPAHRQPSFQHDTTFIDRPQGSEAASLHGWNWGAFWLNWVWGLGNDTPIALLTLVPGVNFVMPFILGAKGNEWAWRNGTWRDVEHFKRVQRIWAWVGWAAALGLPVLAALMYWGMSSLMTSNGAYKLAVNEMRYNLQLEQSLGLPVEPSGGPIIGNIDTQNDSGSAMLSFAVAGPKGKGTASMFGVLIDGRWVLQSLTITTERGEQITLTGSDGA